MPSQWEVNYLSQLNAIFDPGEQHDVSVELNKAANYFSYIADNINHSQVLLTCDKTMFSVFEPLLLWLDDQLRTISGELREKATKLIVDNGLAERFAIFASLSENDMLAMRQAAEGDEKLPLTRSKLFEAKIPLRRLAGLAKYAASLPAQDYDENIEDVKTHYNPDLIEVSRLLAQLVVLRDTLRDAPKNVETATILKRIEYIEAELKRPKVRWGKVIFYVFALFSFVADVKSVFPETYDGAYQAISRIVVGLHVDGQVQKKTPNLIPHDGRDAPPNPEQTTPRDAILPKSEDDDEESATDE